MDLSSSLPPQAVRLSVSKDSGQVQWTIPESAQRIRKRLSVSKDSGHATYSGQNPSPPGVAISSCQLVAHGRCNPCSFTRTRRTPVHGFWSQGRPVRALHHSLLSNALPRESSGMHRPNLAQHRCSSGVRRAPNLTAMPHRGLARQLADHGICMWPHRGRPHAGG